MYYKYLHYEPWCYGGGGFSNTLMSIQLGMIIASLTERGLIVYQKNKLHHQRGEFRIQDLIDFQDVTFINEPMNADCDFLPCEQFICYYFENAPNKEFLLNRSAVNLSDYLEYNELKNSAHGSLSYFSFKFYLENKDRIFKNLYKSFSFKNKYTDIAEEIISKFAPVNSMHIRRGDFLHQQPKNVIHSFEDNLELIFYNFAYDPIFVLTNEQDKSFFKKIPNELFFVDQILEKYNLDPIEIGVISILLGSKIENFIGNAGSTFTGIIHQMRKMNNPIGESFKYLHDQYDLCNIDGSNFYSQGQYTWNKLKRSDYNDCLWQKEWPEVALPYGYSFDLQNQFKN